MEEANQQQRTLISDLQAQVLDIQKQIRAAGPLPPTVVEMRKGVPLTLVKSVLWVDDQPKNNSYFVQQLTEKGVTVDLALSTSDGLRNFAKKTYGAVVSDMGRTEEGTYNATAGLELLQKIRELNAAVPFVIFSSSRSAREFQDKAISLGATMITSSPTEMIGILQATVEANGP